MIQKNLIFEILEILNNEKDTLSEYSYEYSTALLMNLSLRGAGKTKCEENKEKVLDVLNNLLEHDNLQVRTFVNGTLYSLFSRLSLRQQAKSIGLEDYLKSLMDNSDEKFTKQIQYILEQLNNQEVDNNDDDTQSELNEEDTDVDDIDDEEVGDEEELEDNQSIEGITISGEELLQKEFSITSLQLQQQQQQSQQQSQQQAQQQQQSLTQIQEDESQEDLTKQQKKGYKIAEEFVPGYPGETEDAKNQDDDLDLDRSQIPSEMRSRPKILRTPLEGTRPQNQQSLQQSLVGNSFLENSNLDPQKLELRKEAKASNEYHQAFLSSLFYRPKVPRTPPSQN